MSVVKKNGGLVPGKNSSKGAKWIADPGSQYGKKLEKSWGTKGHEYKVSMNVKKGTIQWMKDNSISYDFIGDEKKFTKNVILKSNEPGAFGVGVDLLKKFNKKVASISYKKNSR